MEFYRALYFSPNIEHRGKVKRQLQKGTDNSLTLYVLTLCDLSLTAGTPRAESTGDHSQTEGGENNLWPEGIWGNPKTQGTEDNAQEELAAKLITSVKSGNQLQFFHSFFLKSRRNREHCPMIIGIADGRSEAVKLVQRIVEETWKTDGDCDIVRFLAKRDRRIRVPDQADTADARVQNQSTNHKMEAAARTPGDLT